LADEDVLQPLFVPFGQPGAFGDAQLVELTYHIALENLRGCFNLALGIGPAGFSDGMVCALPATITGT
jgi:hypothetical protein